MKNIRKKLMVFLLTVLSGLLITTTVFGAMHSHGPKWVRSTEIWAILL